MSQESEAQKIRAKQVGVLMKHYRSSFPVGDGRAGLTMEDVLERMAQVNQRYENSAPSTVYRWETGQTMPKKARLQEFGIALNLTQLEIDGLVALAGIDERHRPDATNGAGVVPEDLEDVPVATTGTGPLAPEGAGTFGEPAVRSFLVETLKGGIVQFLLPGLAIAGAGYLLSSLGITEAWIMMLYIGLAIGLVVFQGVLRLTRADSLRDLLFMSLFFVLSAPVMQIPFVHSDHYGFYLLSNPTDSAKLILLSLAACLSLALVASLAFDLLWRWQYFGPRRRQSSSPRNLDRCPARGVRLPVHPFVWPIGGLDPVRVCSERVRRRIHHAGIAERRNRHPLRMGSQIPAMVRVYDRPGLDRNRVRDGTGDLHGIQSAVHQRSHVDPLLGRGLQRVGAL